MKQLLSLCVCIHTALLESMNPLIFCLLCVMPKNVFLLWRPWNCQWLKLLMGGFLEYLVHVLFEWFFWQTPATLLYSSKISLFMDVLEDLVRRQANLITCRFTILWRVLSVPFKYLCSVFLKYLFLNLHTTTHSSFVFAGMFLSSCS